MKSPTRLRLSDFEEYAFRDDSFDLPMVIALRVMIDGTVNIPAFRKSFAQVLARNPLLRSTIKPRLIKSEWVEIDSAELPLSIEKTLQTPSSNCPLQAIDIKNEHGVKFVLRVGLQQSVLLAYFHHACCDGLASIRFIGDVFAAYGRKTATKTEDMPKEREIDQSIIGLRSGRKMPGNCRDRKAPIVHTCVETALLLFRKSFRLRRHKKEQHHRQGDDVGNIIHTQVLPRPILRKIKKFAADRGVHLNDLCLTIFLQLLAQWGDNSKNPPSDLFRILMPVSMRNPDHDKLSAANVVSYVFHSYRRGQIGNFDSLLRKVHRKSQQMVNRNEGAAMLCGFAVARLVPGLFRLAKKLQPDFATAVLTNVGEVRRIFENRFPLDRGRAVAGDVVILKWTPIIGPPA